VLIGNLKPNFPDNKGKTKSGVELDFKTIINDGNGRQVVRPITQPGIRSRLGSGFLQNGESK